MGKKINVNFASFRKLLKPYGTLCTFLVLVPQLPLSRHNQCAACWVDMCPAVRTQLTTPWH